jgi:hypothetical protein
MTDHDETQRAVSDVLRARPPEEIPEGLEARLRARLDSESAIELTGGRVKPMAMPVPPSAAASRWLTLRLAPAFIALALVAGAVAGYVVRQQSTSSAAPLTAAPGAEADARGVVERLRGELSLTDRQRQEVARILAPLQPLAAAAPAELADARTTVRSLLTAAQRERFDRLGDNWSAAP